MKISRYILLLLYILSGIPTGYGQRSDNFRFNFNIDNGLPSNHVYGVITDRLGYLWICTENGIAKYNGYEFKIFNLYDGLTNNDVWELYEDAQGRIWLCSISEEMGYMQNDKYHKPILMDINTTLYPVHITKYEKSIRFVSAYLDGTVEGTICREKDDTIFKYIRTKQVFGLKETENVGGVNYLWHYSFLTEHGKPILVNNGIIYRVDEETKGQKLLRGATIDDTAISMHLKDGHDFIIGDYLFGFDMKSRSDQFFNMISLTTGKTRTVNIHDYDKSGNLYLLLPVKKNGFENYFYAITHNNIVKFKVDSEVRCVKSYAIENFLINKNIDGSKINLLFEDEFWGNALCTSTDGIYLQDVNINQFQKADKLDLKNYKFVGELPDSVGYWWNPTSQTLAKSDRNYLFSYQVYDKVKEIFGIIKYSEDTFLVLGNDNFFLDANSGKLTRIDIFANRVSSGILIDKSSMVEIDLLGFGLVHMAKDGTVIRTNFERERYRHLVLDSSKMAYWAYNDGKVHIHSNIGDSIVSKDQLLRFGVRKIEKIIIDNKYNNVFFKGSVMGDERITMYNRSTNKYMELFKNFNLNGASIYLYRNTLIATGRFGVLFSRITGPDRLSNPVLYRNDKDFNYKYVYDAQMCNNKVLLNTDKGVYTLNMPFDSLFNSPVSTTFTDYKFMLNYQNNIVNIKPNDTIKISQHNPKLRFDIINPCGNGKPKFTYRLNDAKDVTELTSDELNLPLLSPDNYYKVSVQAYDNVWKSDVLSFYVYVQPSWWQTHNAVKLIWAFSILCAILVVAIVVIITQKLEVRANRRKNLRMELELRSIYAQINPHFIFNTLNSALLLVSKNNMDEAYRHISKFSKLLRSYIKSSRNRLISLDEEMTNLRNYIELQQVRFKDKFNYRILADDTIDLRGTQIPSLLLQPFVENAINHGLLAKNGTGNLLIEFHLQKEENILSCTIDDDGIGRKRSKLERERKDKTDESYGNLMIRDLVNVFSKYEKMKIDVEYIDKEEPKTGTIVSIRIKYPKNAG